MGKNVELILRKVEDIWFETYKLRANLALHQRGEKQTNKGKAPTTDSEPGKGVGGEVRQGFTFKQSLVKGGTVIQNHEYGVRMKKPNAKRRLTTPQILNGTMEVEVVQENMKMFEKCWVGKLWDQNDAENIQFKIWMEGFQK
ncbi:hypothetical protein A2U01_0033459, partial [Trifolium medium]|nr:hypothetical protein [Trifolium medium]